MSKHILILCITIIFSSCCTRKGCPGDMLPLLTIQFSGIETEYDNPVIFYTYQDGILKDSAICYLSKNHSQIQFPPFEKYENTNKHYVLKWNNKTETISDLNCDFHEKKIKCNTCFLFIPEMETVTVYDKFSYTSSSQGNITTTETLQVNW